MRVPVTFEFEVTQRGDGRYIATLPGSDASGEGYSQAGAIGDCLWEAGSSDLVIYVQEKLNKQGCQARAQEGLAVEKCSSPDGLPVEIRWDRTAYEWVASTPLADGFLVQAADCSRPDGALEKLTDALSTIRKNGRPLVGCINVDDCVFTTSLPLCQEE